MSIQETSSITLAAGCFWCTQAVYEQLRGVTSIEVGYSNGTTTDRPNYQQVCSGETGFAEVAKIAFDPQEISLDELLEVFFTIHDPTSLNRQGEDIGTQYRSGIFYTESSHGEIAKRMIAEVQASKIYDSPIITEVATLRNFYPAEENHQQYFERNAEQPYCSLVVGPKVNKFKQTFKRLLKE